MYTRKIYATGSATANAVASIVVPTRTRLVMVQWAVLFDSITDGGLLRLEISQTASTEIAVNDSQLCVSELACAGNFVTSGLSQTNLNLVVPVNVAMAQGQKLYLHAVIGGTVTYTGGANLWFD